MRITLVVAMDLDRTIGLDGGLPWRLPADLAHFKRTTTGHTVLMGRATQEEIGRPLPKRRNIVISRRLERAPEGFELFDSPEAALQALEAEGLQDLMVIGGATIYEWFLQRADVLEMTQVQARVKGDTRFPAFDEQGWRETARSERAADERNEHAMVFLRFERVEDGEAPRT